MPWLWALRNVSLPVSIRKNGIPLAFPFRQSDLYGAFELTPLKRQIERTAKAAKAAIDTRCGEGGIFGCEVLRVLVIDSVQWIGCPVALADHLYAIGVVLRRSGLGCVPRFDEGNEIVLEKCRQRGHCFFSRIPTSPLASAALWADSMLRAILSLPCFVDSRISIPCHMKRYQQYLPRL